MIIHIRYFVVFSSDKVISNHSQVTYTLLYISMDANSQSQNLSTPSYCLLFVQGATSEVQLLL